MSKSEDKLLTPETVAAAINRAPQTLAGWRTIGLGPSYEKRGRSVNYRASAVEAWKVSQTKSIERGDEPVPRRRKGLLRDVATAPVVAEAGNTEIMSIRGGIGDDACLWEPVDIEVLTVHDMLTKYADIVVASGAINGAYGVIRTWPKTVPDGWLLFCRGVVAPYPKELPRVPSADTSVYMDELLAEWDAAGKS